MTARAWKELDVKGRRGNTLRVRDQAWLKLLDVVSEKLGAEDARIEIGGRAPEDERLLWAAIDEERRLVVVYQEPPPKRAELLQRLATLLDSFRQTLAIPTEPPARTPGSSQRRELDRVLAALAERTGAETVWIIDTHSPVLWGCSEGHEEALDFDGLITCREADDLLGATAISWTELLATSTADGHALLQRTDLSGLALRMVQDELLVLRQLSEQGGLAAAGKRLRAARALVEIRERASRERELTQTELRGPQIQCYAHAIANQYQLVLVFDETYSPLHAAGNVQRALPYIEHLLLSLPPVDPSAGAAARAKVIRLPRRV